MTYKRLVELQNEELRRVSYRGGRSAYERARERYAAEMLARMPRVPLPISRADVRAALAALWPRLKPKHRAHLRAHHVAPLLPHAPITWVRVELNALKEKTA